MKLKLRWLRKVKPSPNPKPVFAVVDAVGDPQTSEADQRKTAISRHELLMDKLRFAAALLIILTSRWLPAFITAPAVLYLFVSGPRRSKKNLELLCMPQQGTTNVVLPGSMGLCERENNASN